MGPRGRSQSTVMAAMIEASNLSAKVEAAQNLIASSRRWLIKSVLWYKMSHCTTSLNAEASRSVAVMDLGPGRAHMRHDLHVSTISLHRLRAR